MAVGVEIEFGDGATLEQYDEVIKQMGFKPCGTGGPGGLFHWVTKTGNTIRVTDVWESKSDFEKFSEEQIGPITAKVGVPGPPKITFYDVHNYLTAGPKK